MANVIPKLKVGFYDFWPNFWPTDNYFFRVLSMRHQVEIDPANPDIALFSVFGEEHRRLRCKKYHFTGEARKAPRDTYDYSFTFAPTSDTNCRLPLWVLYIDWFDSAYASHRSPSYLVPLASLMERRNPEPKPLFCNFIYNNHSGERVRFLDRLAPLAPVDCLGTLRNNRVHLGGDEFTKVDVLKNYRFTIAFENTIHPGYVTEKILHPLAAQSVPIYWGAPEVFSDFNRRAFIDARNFSTLDALAAAVMDIDANHARWSEIATAPVFPSGLPSGLTPDAIADFFDRTL